MTHKNHHHHHRESSTEPMRSTHHHHHHGEPPSSPVDPHRPTSWTQTTSSMNKPSHSTKGDRHRSRSPPRSHSSHCLSRGPDSSSPQMISSPTANRTFDQISPVPSTGEQQAVSTSAPPLTPFWTFLSVTLTMIFRSLIFRK